MAITIVICDDHDVIREGIKSILCAEPEYKVVAEAANGEEALEKVQKFKPNFLLLDISMPKRSGLDILSQVHYVSPDTNVIMVTVHRAKIYIDKIFKLGVKGYLHKENVAEDLLPAMRKILRGDTYVSSKISQDLVEKAAKFGEPESIKKEVQLSSRESDILRLVVEGKTAKEMATILFISPRTVENYKNSLLKKLNLHRTSDLIKYAIKHKIVEVEE